MNTSLENLAITLFESMAADEREAFQMFLEARLEMLSFDSLPLRAEEFTNGTHKFGGVRTETFNRLRKSERALA